MSTQQNNFIKSIKEPTVIIDIDICQKNTEKMLKLVGNKPQHFRPHFKTHQSAPLADKIFKPAKLEKICVSSVKMAWYFYLQGGWDDITIAFPTNILEIDQINELSKKIKQLNIILDNEQTAQFLVKNITSPIGIYIELDLGQHRSGVNLHKIKCKRSNNLQQDDDLETHQKGIEKIDSILKIFNDCKMTNKNIIFKGFLNHSGHSYGHTCEQAKLEIYNIAMQELQDLKQKKASSRFPDLYTSYGDTPTLSILKEKIPDHLDEIRPGNFIFYDVMQYFMGSCEIKDVAIALACPVVGVYEDRKQICIYGGGIHLAKDVATDKNGKKCYGIPVTFNQEGQNGWKVIPNSTVSSISQEHGVISVENLDVLKQIKVGDIIGILPIHSCMTVDMFPDMYDLDGNVYTTINSSKIIQNNHSQQQQ